MRVREGVYKLVIKFTCQVPNDHRVPLSVISTWLADRNNRNQELRDQARSTCYKVDSLSADNRLQFCVEYNDHRTNSRTSKAISGKAAFARAAGIRRYLSRFAAEMEFQNQPDGGPRARRDYLQALRRIFFCRRAPASDLRFRLCNRHRLGRRLSRTPIKIMGTRSRNDFDRVEPAKSHFPSRSSPGLGPARHYGTRFAGGDGSNPG